VVATAAATGLLASAAMSLVATVIDPLTGQVPPEWDQFADAHRLLPGWYSGVLRAVNWCVPVASSMVIVHEPNGTQPVALFHARHLGPTNLARLVRPGARPAWASLAECRTAPFPVEPGLAFAAGTGPADRIEALRRFEQALRRRTGPGGIAITYRNLPEPDLPLVTTGTRVQRRLQPRMVLDNQWSDLPSYLGSLPAKWRSQLRKVSEAVTEDPSLRVEFADTIEAAPACWLAEVVRLRYESGRLLPRPPAPAYAIAELAKLPGCRFLTYRDGRGDLLGYSTFYDDGTDLLLIWWGSRSETDGWRRDIYFDQYLRLVQLMIDTGRRRLTLGGGMERIKARYGARPQYRWEVIGPLGMVAGRPGRGRRPLARLAEQPAPPPPPSPPPPAPAPAGDRSAAGRLGGWLLTWFGRSPRRADTTVACRQCGRSESVNVLRLGRSSARYWCQHCGAVVRLADLAQLRPISDKQQPPTRPAAPDATPADMAAGRAAAAAPAGAADATDADGSALSEFMPAAMQRWLRQRSRRPLAPRQLSKAAIYQHYRDWDRHLRQLGPVAAARLAGPGEPAPVPGLPAFSQVVGLLHETCYQLDPVVTRLHPPGPADLVTALRQRAEHARRWLARYGRELCWLHSRLPEGRLVDPDPAVVTAALAALRDGGPLDPAAARAARAALFGTDGGPGLAALLRTYPAEQFVAGLREYLATGSRPLREQALARLAGD
jgi:hypothetical protein